MSESTQTYEFQAEVNQVLSLVINSLYSNKEIFLRELVSNASDALDKMRFRSVTEPDLLGDTPELRVRLFTDEDNKTLTIADTGIGMTRDELVENLGTVAKSGSREFLKHLQDAASSNSDDVQLIGQFGVGFYSSFLVADKVEVVSRAAGEDKAWRWTSDAGQTFTIEEAQRDERGTDIILHLKEDQHDLVQSWKLRSLVTKYSDYLSHPIEMEVTTPAEEEGGEATTSFEQLNQSQAIWRRSASEVEEEQYTEFYKHLTHDWEAPLETVHFKIEGTQMFIGLLFIPARPPFDLFDRDSKGGVRLYVRRVFIMDECDDLVPPWLRFVRGIIDSDDLPLNVSREILQDSKTSRAIRKQVVKKVLGALEDMAENRKDDYASFWDKFGVVLKEGVHFETKHKERIGSLLRFASSSQEELTSLDDYISRMPEDQKDIYYIVGPTRALVEQSPHLEALRKRGYEILFMTDAIDQWVVDGLSEYNGKSLVSAMKADLKLDDETSEEDQEAQKTTFEPLTNAFQSILSSKIQDVRISERLTDSPVCLVLPDGGLPSHLERLLRANQQNLPETRRILEINPTHPLIENLLNLQNDTGEDAVKPWVELLYDHALLTEGSPIENPGNFATRMTDLMQQAIRTQVQAEPT